MLWDNVVVEFDGFSIECDGELPRRVNAFELAELDRRGELIGIKVRSGATGKFLSLEEIELVTQSVQMPPQLNHPVAQNAPLDGNLDPMRFVAPIHTSVWALVAGYLGLISMLLVFAPFSLIAGVLALRDLKAHPHKTGKGRAIFAVVMGVVFSVILVAVLGGIIFAPKS